MAEFIEITKIQARMCDESCLKCPVGSKLNGYDESCSDFRLNHPEEFERICLKWDKENPELTNKAKLYEVLKETFGEQIAQTMLPELSCDLFDCGDMVCHNCCYNGFWDKPYIELKESE